jgi:hypothetical protein
MATKPISEHNRKRFEAISMILHEYRINNCLTQSEISQNIHRNSIVRAEKSAHNSLHPQNMTLLTLFEIVDGLDLSLKELFLEID